MDRRSEPLNSCRLAVLTCVMLFAGPVTVAHGDNTADRPIASVSLHDAPATAEPPFPILLDAVPPQPPPFPDDPSVVRSRAVDVHLLDDSEPTEPQRLRFDLFDDVSIDGTVVRRVVRSPISFTWFGRLDGDANGTFTLVVENDVIAAGIRSPRYGMFEVRPGAGAYYHVLEIDESAHPECGVDEHEHAQIPVGDPALADGLGQMAPDDAAAPLGLGCSDDGFEIDVLVAYTPAARDAAGGTAAMAALIQLAVDNANLSYDDSLVNTQVVLVHQAETNYDESGDHLDLLRGPDDGVMDEVHALRDTFKADLVSLITDSGAYQGVAYQMNAGNVTLMEDFAFSVTRVSAIGGLTFAHELGHNMGCLHDRDNAGAGIGWSSSSFGYRVPSGPAPFRTVMAYECPPPDSCPRVTHFSNPEVDYESQPTGVPAALPNAAFNSLTLNQTKGYVANFRKRTPPDCNGNGFPDDQDIADQFSLDENANGIPDECEVRLYVDADALPGGDGRSWITAFHDLQDALAEAGDPCSTETTTEIWVAAGTYTPDRGIGDRKAVFQLQNIPMYGGFAGFEASLAQRAELFDLTILSGDLAKNDFFPLNTGENAYHVVSGSWTDQRAVLDGFTITGGNANGSTQPFAFGGGLYSVISSMTIRNCLFLRNRAAQYGGGVFAGSGGITFADCAFRENSANFFGGGIYSVGGSPTITDSLFEFNFASLGGGLHAFGGRPTLVNAVVADNTADSGAGWSFAQTDAAATNATISGNAAQFVGGGMYVSQSSTLTLRNTIIAGNTAQDGAATGAPAQLYDDPFFGANVISVEHCMVQDDDPDDGVAYPGIGNIDDDPLFINAFAGDFHLQPGSPVIDAGTNFAPALADVDFDGNPRRIDDPDTLDCPQPGATCGAPPVVDIGAFEYRNPDAEIQPPLPAPYPHDRPKNRYISFDANKLANGTVNTAFKVTLTSLQLGSCLESGAPCRLAESGGHNEPGDADCGRCSLGQNTCISSTVDCPSGESCVVTGEACVNDQAGSVGMSWWVGPESPMGNGVHLLVSEPFRRTDLGAMWPDVVHVGDCEIVPRAGYEVQAANADTGTLSPALTVNTIERPIGNVAWWADCVGGFSYFCDGDTRNEPCDPETNPCALGLPCKGAYPPPNGFTNFDDISAAVALFVSPPGRILPDMTWVDLHGNASATTGSEAFDPPNYVTNFADIGVIVLAFQGRPYPYSDPGDCPDVGAWP